MKGDPEIIEMLNEVLTAELTAINQYFIHSKMAEDWGHHTLAKHSYDESIDEMRHADSVIARILFLEGVPNMQRYFKVRVGKDVKEQMENDLALEYEAIQRLNQAIQMSEGKKDFATAELLRKILVDEEEHADWLETQLHQIEHYGLATYLMQHGGNPISSGGSLQHGH